MTSWKAVEASLKALTRYEDDWDGLGSRAPTLDALHAARAWVTLLQSFDVPPPESLTPSLEGGVQLAWRHDGLYREIEFDEQGDANPFLTSLKDLET